MASNMRRDAVHTQDGVFWLASFVGALLVSSLVAILRSSTAEHPTVNRTVTGSNPVAGAFPRYLVPGFFFISELMSPVLHSEAESARLGLSTRECRVISTKAGEALEEPESSVAGIGPIRIAEG